MFYRIRDGLKFCNTGEEFIFLDAGAGRYFSLPHPTHGAFATLIGERGPLSPEVSRDLRVLIDRGYLIADERRFEFASLAARQLTDSIKPDIYIFPSVRLLASAISWQIFFAVLLRALPLGSVLSKLPKCHPGSVALPFDVLEAVAAFKKAAWLFGETDRCLVQSLATCALLRRQGVPCRFAIGVRSRPFAAHAWVELDAQVVNDDLENVRQFTPILVQE